MRPTPSLIVQLPNGAQLWASGQFWGVEEWVKEHDIELVVNLLGRSWQRLRTWEGGT